MTEHQVFAGVIIILGGMLPLAGYIGIRIGRLQVMDMLRKQWSKQGIHLPSDEELSESLKISL